MAVFSWPEGDEKTTTAEGNDGLLLAGLWAFSWLMGTLLVMGLGANVYLIRVSTRHRFPVQWDTFRTILRHSSVVDLSQCFALAAVVFRSVIMSRTGSRLESSSVQCMRFDINSLLYAGGVVVASGVVVVARQTIMLVAFEQEVALLRQNRMRTARLVRDITVVGIVCLLATTALSPVAPSVDQPLCYVTWSMSSRLYQLVLVPVAVSVLVGVVDVVSRPPDTVPTSDSEHVTDSRWTRFVISAHVAAITWFVLAAALTAAGLLLQPVSVDVLMALTGGVVLTSVWSAFAVARHWT